MGNLPPAKNLYNPENKPNTESYDANCLYFEMFYQQIILKASRKGYNSCTWRQDYMMTDKRIKYLDDLGYSVIVRDYPYVFDYDYEVLVSWNFKEKDNKNTRTDTEFDDSFQGAVDWQQKYGAPLMWLKSNVLDKELKTGKTGQTGQTGQ